MTPTRPFIVLALVTLGAAVLAQSRARGDRHPAPPSPSGNIVVALCDGETTAEIPGVEEGETPTSAQARDVADRLMTAWRQKNPAARWEEAPVRLAQAERTGDAPQGEAGGMPAGAQGEVQGGHTYGAFSERDQHIWAAETNKFVREGRRVFHDAKALGSTIAVSCDMCHPDGANTHPETYPKFQVQLGRVALLRDMINWCIQNPTRGKPLPEDDPRLKAIEAYILAQRKGTPLEYGKH